jgi:hypothetical protein
MVTILKERMKEKWGIDEENKRRKQKHEKSIERSKNILNKSGIADRALPCGLGIWGGGEGLTSPVHKK